MKDNIRTKATLMQADQQPKAGPALGIVEVYLGGYCHVFSATGGEGEEEKDVE